MECIKRFVIHPLDLMKQTRGSLAKVRNLRKVVVLAALLLLAVGVTVAYAQTGSGYDLSRWTVDGGGITDRTVGEYTLSGTIGQPDADALSSDDYTLGGGFWGGVAVSYRVYLPLVLRNY